MKSINNFLDATYLKTAKEAEISENKDIEIIKKTVKEAIENNCKAVMIRPYHVRLAKDLKQKAHSNIIIGTVISFPDGVATFEEKIAEATKAIHDGAEELDFVCNYNAFKKNEIAIVKNEIYQCTKFVLESNKTIKWIIEVASLNASEIIRLTVLIKNIVIANFKEEEYQNVFIKSSTGFFKTQNNMPNGATKEAIVIMLENGSPLPIKASGGIQTYEQAIEMIKLGVKRIGTSNASAILNGGDTKTSY